MIGLDETHDPALSSWVESANDPETDFPPQNLPLGRFRARGSAETFRFGVAIGDRVLDLRAAASCRWPAEMRSWLTPLAAGELNGFMTLGPAAWRGLRLQLSAALTRGAALESELRACLHAQDAVELSLPCTIGDYTDFYTGIHHATRVGQQFRPDNPLLPNYQWVPIGYHGRSSSIVVSGTPVRRPRGQRKADNDVAPHVGPSQRLDYELELAAWIGQGNTLGEPIAIARTGEHLFGVCLLNDWSARDLQAWEYQPLGPFLAKSFATSISPWIVSMDALAPFRVPLVRSAADPAPLHYLDCAYEREHGAFALSVEAWLLTAAARAQGQPAQRLSRSLWSEAAYWTLGQLVAHHSSNGCNLRPGDLLGTGTLSGPALEAAGCLLELSRGGQQPVEIAGESRSFLEDGDTVILRAYAERAGARRIGLGECAGLLLPAAA